MLPAFNGQAESGIEVEPPCFIHDHSVIGFIHVTSSVAGNGLFAASFLAPSAMPTCTQAVLTCSGGQLAGGPC